MTRSSQSGVAPATATRSDWDLAAYRTIRRRRDLLLRPLSTRMASWGVPAASISVAGVSFAAAACWALPHSRLQAMLAFLAALGCDALDGAVARRRGTAGKGGKAVDHACDAATFLCVLLAIARAGLCAPSAALLAAILTAPLLLLAVAQRRRRSGPGQEPSGGFLAHLFKVPVYVAFLLYTAAGVDWMAAAVRSANVVALASFGLLLAASLRPSPGTGAGRRADTPTAD